MRSSAACRRWQRFELDLDGLEADRFDVTGAFFGSAIDGPFRLFVDNVRFD